MICVAMRRAPCAAPFPEACPPRVYQLHDYERGNVTHYAAERVRCLGGRRCFGQRSPQLYLPYYLSYK